MVHARQILKFTLFFLLTFGCHNIFSQTYLEEIIELEKKHFLAPQEVNSSGIGKEYNLKYHRFYWEVNPAVNYLKGNVYSEFEIVSTTDHIRFDLQDNMIIDSVLFHSISTPYTQTNDVLDINLNVTLNPGESDSIQVFYQGTPLSTGFGSWQFGSHSTGPIISTLSEPYGAKEWWPCKQGLDDKIDSIDIFIEIPDQYLAASNGIIKSTTTIPGNKKVVHWSHRYPIPAYLIAISVTNYVEFSDYLPLANNDSLEILNYCYPQSLSNWQNLSSETIPLLQLYDSLFEAYPFMNEKYGHAEWELGGGMEHQTMSFMGTLNLGLVAHELAHQWFGDKITCGSWEDIWLNEGFATYLTGIAFENGYGVGPNLWLNWRTGVINNVTSQAGGSVFVDDTSSVSRIFSSRLSYNKGALLLHMLRWKMGDEVFFGAIQNYLQDSSLAYSYARTDDLKFYLEEESNMNLDEFFNDWYYGEGYPTYNLFLEKNQNGDYELTVNQNQSHPSVSFFEMPIEVEFRGLGVDTTIVFDHTFDGQVFTIDLPFNVWAYEFDPDLWLCAKASETLALEGNVIGDIVKIFPNPGNGVFTIELLESNSLNPNISVLDYSGKMLDCKIKKLDYQHFEVKLSNAASGIYILKIDFDDKRYTSRIIVND